MLEELDKVVSRREVLQQTMGLMLWFKLSQVSSSQPYSDLASQLSLWDIQVAQNIENGNLPFFEDIALQINQKAEEVFRWKFGDPTRNLNGRPHFLWHDQYQQAIESHINCLGIYREYPSASFTAVETDNIYSDLNIYAFIDSSSRAIRPNPASLLFTDRIHEEWHRRAPYLDIPTISRRLHSRMVAGGIPLNCHKARGLAIYAPIPSQSLPGRDCFWVISREVDEAFVQANTISLIRELGINLTSYAYQEWVLRLEQALLSNLTPTESSHFINLHQSSQSEQAFAFLGNKLNLYHPTPQEAARSFLQDFIDPI